MPHLLLHKHRRILSTATSIGNKFGFKNILFLALRVSHESRFFFKFFLSALFLCFSSQFQENFCFKFQNWNFTSCHSLIFLPAGNLFFPGQNFIQNSDSFFLLSFLPSNFPRSQDNLGGHRLLCVYKVQIPGSRRKFSSSNCSCFHDFAHCYCSVPKNGFKSIHSQEIRSHNFPF